MDVPYTTKPRSDTGLYNAKLGIWLFLASEVMLFGALFSSYILLRVNALEGTWPHGLLNIPIGTFNTAVLISSSITVVMAWASLKLGKFNHFKIYQGLTILCALAFMVIKSVEYKDKFTHYEVWFNDHEKKSIRGHIEVPGEEGNPWFMTHKKLAERKIETIKIHPDPKVTVASGKEAHGGAEAHDGHGDHPPVQEIKVADIKRLSAFVPAHSTYFAIYFTLTALHALHVMGGALVMAYLWGPGSKMWKTDPERFTNRIEVSGLFWHFVDLVWIFLFPVLYLL
ncbi:MAG: cyoC [Verrucomicrobia bacterium]|jgi:cytochrome c oxidase subunit 3|nr:cyoC [Verrucomicrobiota bacterium]